ncbi:hypothetical protein [Burkholderia pyrrocinia]|uniref:hypothetical protein n=1 Tax=Burkholderia pyrrocinia TaxID=60550 RepID=UPI003D766976
MSLHDANIKLSTRNERLQCASRAGRIERLPPIESLEQEHELCGRQRNNAGIGARPREASFLEALREQAETTVTPPQAFQQVAALTPEHEHVPAVGILLQYFAASELKPERMSVTPAAIQIRGSAGSLQALS